MIKDNLSLPEQTILRALEVNDSLRVHIGYYAEVFALSSQGAITFSEINEEHWRGFEVRRVEEGQRWLQS